MWESWAYTTPGLNNTNEKKRSKSHRHRAQYVNLIAAPAGTAPEEEVQALGADVAEGDGLGACGGMTPKHQSHAIVEASALLRCRFAKTLTLFTSQHKLRDAQEELAQSVYRFRAAEEANAPNLFALKREMEFLDRKSNTADTASTQGSRLKSTSNGPYFQNAVQSQLGSIQIHYQ